MKSFSSVDVTFDVYCEECGNKLSTSVEFGRHATFSVCVAPCEKCIEKAEENVKVDLTTDHEKTVEGLEDKIEELTQKIDDIYTMHPEITL